MEELFADTLSSLAWFWGTIVLLGLFCIALFAVALRWGPKRGTWNQPAAALRAPGRRVTRALWAFAAGHVLLGLVAAIVVPGFSFGILAIALFMGAFYIACAEVMRIAHVGEPLRARVQRGRHSASH